MSRRGRSTSSTRSAAPDEGFHRGEVDDPAEGLADGDRGLCSVADRAGTDAGEGDLGEEQERDERRGAIQCLIDLQRRAGGNSMIGREVYPLLARAGYRNVRVTPRVVYVDASRPALVDGFTRRTFTAMVEGVGRQAVDVGLVDEASRSDGIGDLYRTAEPDGTFCYTFFKGVGVR